MAHTLGSGGKAIITAIDQYGSEFQIRRILNEYPEVYVNNKLQPGVSIRETVIRNPIYFGQKISLPAAKVLKRIWLKNWLEKVSTTSVVRLKKKQIVSDTVLRLQKLPILTNKLLIIPKESRMLSLTWVSLKYGIEEKFKNKPILIPMNVK